jgi:hypothetical protein
VRPVLALIGACLCAASSAFPALAQTSVNYTTVVNNKVAPVTYTVQGIYWPTNSEFVTQLPANGGSTETWNTGTYGIDFRVDTLAHWGLHINAMTGSQGSGTFLGTSGGGLSFNGTDTLWSADVSYQWVRPVPDNPTKVSTFRGFIGWGDTKASTSLSNLTALGFAFNSATLTVESSGARVGFDFTYPFPSGWSLDAGLTYYPSTNTTGTVVGPGIGASALSAGGTGWDGSGGLRYTGTGGWNVEVGYRYVRQNQNALSVAGVPVCPCHTQWQGPYVGLGVTL